MEIELTGRTRYAERRRLFRRPRTVLEVEERRSFEHWSNYGGMVDVEEVVQVGWRLATVADLLNLEKDGMMPPELGQRMAALLES